MLDTKQRTCQSPSNSPDSLLYPTSFFSSSAEKLPSSSQSLCYKTSSKSIIDIKKQEQKKMHTVKEKVSNAAAAAKEHIDIMKARAGEAEAKAVATTKEEKKIAKEVRKAKEAEAEMKLHQTHAENAAEKLREKHSHRAFGHHNPVYGAQGHHDPVGTTVPTTGVPAPTYPLGGHPPGVHPPAHHNKYL